MSKPPKRNLTFQSPKLDKRVWMTFPGDFKKRGAALLHQQCWCFGFDVRRKVHGTRANLLLELGFDRVPPPEGKLGATTYQWHGDEGTTVTLWGFGMCFGDEHGGIFVSRFAFWPRIGPVAAPPQAYSPAHLNDFRASRRLDECNSALGYFAKALLWLADYERQVALVAGQTHREQALTAWRHGVSKANETPNHWETLSQQSHELARFWMRSNNTTCNIARDQ